MRAEDTTCVACVASLRGSRAPTGAFSAAPKDAGAAPVLRRPPDDPPPRFDGSAAIAMATAAPRPTPPLGLAAAEDAGAGGGTRPSRPPPAPTPAAGTAAIIASETGRFAAQRPTPSAQALARPPVLASEALRRDLAPAAPGARAARTVAVATGVAGAMVTALLAGPQGFGLPVGGALLVVAMLGIVPLPYAARALALAAVSGSGMAVVSWHGFTAGAVDVQGLILHAGVLVLAMALLFRAWHRGSLLARALVALGVALCAGWLFMSGMLGALLVLDSAVQSWLGPVLSVALVVLLMLSMLAFMDSRATGGCAVWAGLLLGWSATHGAVELLGRSWRPGDAQPSLSALSDDVWVALATTPMFGIALAVALAQLLAVATAERS
jgi:hypothetical protein